MSKTSAVEIKESNSKLHDIAEWIIYSKWFFLAVTFLMISVAILQFILFCSNVTIINDLKMNNISEASAWNQAQVWLRLILSGEGATFATLSILMVNRGDKRFWILALIATTSLTINGFLSELFFEAMKWFIVGTILMTNAVIWNMPSIKIKAKRMNVWLAIAITVLIIVIMGTIGHFCVAKIPESSPFYNSMPILDPVQSGLTVVGNILIISKLAESRIIFGVGSFVTVLMFLIKTINGDLVSLNQVIQGILYIVITIAGFLVLVNEHSKIK